MREQIICDEQLVKDYIAGHEKALQILINRHQSKVYTTIYMLVRDQQLAEDIFQDTFVKVIKTLRGGRYNEEGKFLQWVSRIARNLVIDHFRKAKKMPTISDSEGNDVFEYINVAEDTQEDILIGQERDEKVRLLIQHLPAEQKEVLIMRHYAKMSFKEIAELTDVSINTALGRMRYALQNMRKMIVKHNVSF